MAQRSLKTAVFLVFFVCTCLGISLEAQKKRSVSEYQFMHDKGKTIQSLKRLMWLYNAMGGVHSTSGRAASQSDSLWKRQKRLTHPSRNRDIRGLYTHNLVKQILISLITDAHFPRL
ncbi:parathyroid hormone 4-like [Monodelphis domestica]|uniref:parathyroid hormone 4-like n=1 Tax=Monodelphis domestica TaxID=13616 RepID=UPI0024E26538|nr:parathyroid hormone 4-like [Monodelphis domestica]